VGILEGSSTEDLKRTDYRYSVIVTQDCDLEQDWAAREEQRRQARSDPGDQALTHIMLVPAFVAEAFAAGTHFADRRMEGWGSKRFKHIEEHTLVRYHFLTREEGLLEQNLVVDFKHYFTVDRDCFYRQAKEARTFDYLCSLGILYREAFSRRFSEYLSRIGFPPTNVQVLGLACPEDAADSATP